MNDSDVTPTSSERVATRPPSHQAATGQPPGRVSCGDRASGRLVGVRHPFAFAPSYRLPALLLGITPRTAWVEVGRAGLEVRYGAWRLRTGIDPRVGFGG